VVFLLLFSLRAGLFDYHIVFLPFGGYGSKVHSRTFFYDRLRFYTNGIVTKEHYSVRPIGFVPQYENKRLKICIGDKNI
jgi:hypothetical protein